MSSGSALPLKVPSNTNATPSKATTNGSDPSGTRTPTRQPTAAIPNEISSPHELTAFVETLLEQLETKFDDMSTQILDRMMQMSQRVDALEVSIQDIINGDMSSTTPVTSQSGTPLPTGPKRNPSVQSINQ
ncbi:hypothetical protein CONPUDRAFT_51277 [Coniophora puteana RWD-64-598 SS2]|uniref:Heat shock factor-binding protein 1 n=1 Tax=Coniophora puteana (strain RWD-64-598) TaxID=741705 RepID=A0A5M3MXT9_CONPW|nr:uncharacterized protein CONPUDRAFT_51277 [Coniophora puteana RWD-64-598 SS2]EIW83594.1 hypothetical protein CONPUDRAFT_51277 [Coniophora puteana RWD-64-598 SS2]